MACMFYFASCMNIIFNSLLVQLVKYDVHTTHKIKFIHAIFYHILLFSGIAVRCTTAAISLCVSVCSCLCFYLSVSLSFCVCVCLCVCVCDS